MKTETKITLTVAQLDDLMSFIGDSDKDTEVGIDLFPEEWTDQETDELHPAGLYAYFAEYPEEGVYGPLGSQQSTSLPVVAGEGK